MSDSDLQPIAPEAAVELYLDGRRDELTKETLKSHKYRLQTFAEWCEDNDITNINDITGRMLHQYRVDRREDGLEPVSIRGQLSTLRQFIRFCESIDAAPENLASKILIPKLSENEQVNHTKLDQERAGEILAYLDQYDYASREHLILTLLWKTGMRTGSLRSLDLEDFRPDEQALAVIHRPETGTPLKNKQRGERLVAIDEQLVQLIEDYIQIHREEIRDEHGREPLITTAHGRVSSTTIRDTVYRLTQPCRIGNDCPHDEVPRECPAWGARTSSKCPSCRSPHEVRSGSITSHLLDDIPTEVISDRCDVSQDVLARHYDQRSEFERMEQRRKYLSKN